MSGIWLRLASTWPTAVNDAQPSSQTQRLPPELWAIIIDFAIDEVRHPYRYCTSGTFSQFQKGLFYSGSLRENLFLRDWRTIRSVCRIWSRFAGPRPYLRICNVFPPEDRTLQEASSLFMGYKTNQVKTLNYLVQNPTLSRNLTTLTFGYMYPDRSDVIDLFLDNPSSFPNLHCLVLPNIETNQPIWQRIQDGFPKLVALTIHQYKGVDNGHYTLENLEILDTYAWIHYRLSCPALKHICIRGYTGDTVDHFLRIHGHQLESLLLDYQRPSILAPGPRKFWATFSNLESLGIYPQQPNFGGPRFKHPLRHLRLFSHRGSITPSIVLSEIGSFKGLTHVHVDVDDFYLVEEENGSRLADELRDRCREMGVELVEVPSTKYPRTSKRAEWWTNAMIDTVLMITCPCWFLLIILCPPRGFVPK
ncbi:hypothetical protein FRC19_004700 [Serendipita sp. 401]|nr:hypothetical protein FRC19_004700 [Serendipita sp. 401]KAG9054899.1 hypothetical protein FS842_003829 [Serendipita sp. 407]